MGSGMNVLGKTIFPATWVTQHELMATAGDEKRMWLYWGKSGKMPSNARLSDNPEGQILTDPPMQQTFTKHPHALGKLRLYQNCHLSKCLSDAERDHRWHS